MIAASQDRYDSLQLVQLALSLRRSPEAEIPEPLQEQFMEILKQAMVLVQDPMSAVEHAKHWSPEAIVLAVILRRKDQKGLADDILGLNSFTSITPPLAGKILDSIESGLAA